MNYVPWSPIQLSPECGLLVDHVLHAHAEAAFRDNLSTMAIKACGQAKVPFNQAVAAALCTIGGAHAPVERAMMVFDSRRTTEEIVSTPPVPGWGNDFVKGGRDIIWDGAHNLVTEHWPTMAHRIDEVTALLFRSGKEIYPNAACYTAVAAILTRCPPRLSSWFFIEGRLGSWAKTFS